MEKHRLESRMSVIRKLSERGVKYFVEQLHAMGIDIATHDSGRGSE